MTQEKKVGILGLGKHLPDNVMTNKDLENMVDTTDEWITKRTGIKERRIAGTDEATSDMALAAAENALKDAKLKATDLEVRALINAGAYSQTLGNPHLRSSLFLFLGNRHADVAHDLPGALKHL